MIDRDGLVTSSQGVSARVFGWWAERPIIQSLVLVVMTSIALVGYIQPSLILDVIQPQAVESKPEQTSAGSRRSPIQDQRVKSQAASVKPFQVAGGECVVVATSPDFFTAPGLAAMRGVVSELEALPQVRSVTWLDNVPSFNLFGLSGTLLPSSNASPRQLQSARETILENPLAVGQLISPDGETLLLHVRIDWFYVTSDDAVTTELRTAAERAATAVTSSDIEFRVTGPIPLHLMTAESHVMNAMQYQLIGYSIMLLSALVLFRGVAAVFIVAVAPAMGVFWTMGMLHFFDLQDNPFNDIIVPVLISLVGLTDAVHLMVEIRSQRASGHSAIDAARRGIARVGMACVLTSLTTAIGFVSLTQAHHEIVRDFGWCCVVGVAMTLLSVLTVVPLGCRSPLGRRLHVGLGKSLVEGQLKRIGPVVDWVIRHERAIAWSAIATTVALTLVCTKLSPDEKRYSTLSESAEAAVALRHLDRTLGGLEFGFVTLNWDEPASESDVLVVLQEVNTTLQNEPLIGHPLGLYQLLSALPGDGDASERMSLLELLPPELKRAFYLPESRYASVQFRIQDIGIAAYGDAFARIETKLSEIMSRHSEFRLSLDGDAPWRWRHIYRIVNDLATSLGTASLVIWIVLTIAYRSIRIGLISIIPNLFPLVATGSFLVMLGQHLEMVTVCVFTICVGIAVDDTIHFLTRYQEESRLGGDNKEVIRRAFTGVGAALLMTTVVLVAGMLSAVAGDARDARLFGIMGSITLTTALFADVIFLPAILCRFGKIKVNSGP